MVANIIQTSKLKLNEIDPKETIQILIKATTDLTAIKAEWDGITRFFLNMTARLSNLQHKVFWFMNSLILFEVQCW